VARSLLAPRLGAVAAVMLLVGVVALPSALASDAPPVPTGFPWIYICQGKPGQTPCDPCQYICLQAELELP
jgi:hypothetical protein